MIVGDLAPSKLGNLACLHTINPKVNILLQSLSKIKKMSAEMLAQQRVAAHEISETTPVSLTTNLQRFCDSLGGEAPSFVPVVDDPHGLFGWCSDGVEEKIKSDGGKIVFGWTIWEWPNVLWTAEFHAIWRSPTDELIDITPKPNLEKQILFVVDRRYSETFNFDQRPGNIRQRAYTPPGAEKLAIERIATLKPSQATYEQRRADKAGMSLEQWFQHKAPKDTLAPKIDAFISACDAHEEYFDKLGVSGEIQMNPKLETLLRSRMTTQMALMRELGKRTDS